LVVVDTKLTVGTFDAGEGGINSREGGGAGMEGKCVGLEAAGKENASPRS